MGFPSASARAVSFAIMLFLLPQGNTEDPSVLKSTEELQKKVDARETSLICASKEYCVKFEEKMSSMISNLEIKLNARIQQLGSKYDPDDMSQDSSLYRPLTEVDSEQVKTMYKTVESTCNKCSSDLKAIMEGFESKFNSSIERLQKDTSSISEAVTELSSIHSKVNSTLEELADNRKLWNSVNTDKLKCKKGWHFFEDSCYYFSTNEANWAQGRDNCLEMGAQYVKITTNAEWEFIAGHTTANSWIGLNDIEEEGVYKWSSDGSIENEIKKTWWHDYQPDNYQNNEDCIHYWFVVGKKRWNDSTCEHHMRYVCEMKQEETLAQEAVLSE